MRRKILKQPTDIVVKRDAVPPGGVPWEQDFTSHRSVELFFTCIFGCEQQFGAVVGVRPNAELAGLRVKGELVEPHRADEGDVGGLAVPYYTL